MKIHKKDFLIQVKYVDLVSSPDSIQKCFCGFGGELYLSKEEIASYDTSIIDSVKSFIRSNNLVLRLHSPIVDTLKPFYNEVTRLSGILGVRDVVVHGEWNDDWPRLANAFADSGINIIIENHNEPTPEPLVKLVREINLPSVSLCFDAGHFNVFGKAGTIESLEKYPKGSVTEVHLSDNKGDDDTHLPLGEGNIDFAAFFKALARRGEHHVFVLEPQDVGDIEKSIKFLRDNGWIAV